MLQSDNLELQISQTKKELESLQNELSTIASSNKNLGNRFILEENILEKEILLVGLEKSREELTIKAPFKGKVYFKDIFKNGQWVNPKDPIFHIYNSDSSKIIAYIEDYNYDYITKIKDGKFISNNGLLEHLDVNIENISKVSLTNIEYPELSSLYNGQIAVRQDNKDCHKLITEKAYFKIKAQLDKNKYNFTTRLDGILHIKSKSSSFMTRAFELSYNTIIKESGF